MTASALALGALVATVFVATALAVQLYLTARARQIAAMAKCREAFFRAASNLLRDDDTPSIVVDALEAMVRLIDKPQMGRHLLWAALSGGLSYAMRNPSTRSRDLMAAYLLMRPELRRLYGEAAANSMVAATFTNSVLGTLIRRLVLYWSREQQDTAPRTEAALLDLMPSKAVKFAHA